MDAKQQQRKAFKFQDLALEQIRWADWFQLSVLEITVGVIIDLSLHDTDLGAMWVIAGAVTSLITAVFYIAGMFRWRNPRSAATFSTVFSVAMLVDKLFVLALSILTAVRYLNKASQ